MAQTFYGVPFITAEERPTRKVVMECTVDAEEWDEFLAGSPDPVSNLEARMDEVYGDDGAVLTTLHVCNVKVFDDV